MTAGTTITREEFQEAWRSAYLFSLDHYPDEEVAWESVRWRELHAPSIAALCDDLLDQRRRDDFFIPTEISPSDLTLLWQRLPRADVLTWVRSGGLCLLAALRATYWLGLSTWESAS